MNKKNIWRIGLLCASLTGVGTTVAADTKLYWGDTHLHTNNSPDAYLMQNRSADPDTAYRYAKGLPVVHPYHKARVQIHTPLDFLVVSDHAEFMGVVPRILQGDPLVANTPIGKKYRQMTADGKEIEVFRDIIAQINGVRPPDKDLNNPKINRVVWESIMDAADRHNEPGKFTAFMGWEWTSTPDGANLHRVVILKQGKKVGKQFIPYSAFDSDKPEDLWNWLDKTSAKTGASFLAIPHNSNISQGKMFPLMDSEGKMITAQYAKLRMRWEPIVEVTQIKGDSETHPKLSPKDKFADFETYDHLIVADESIKSKSMFSEGFVGELTPKEQEYIKKHEKRVAKVGDYVRTGLLRGLYLKERLGVNPYKFGMIGSTDSHTGLPSAEENNFHGKMAIDSTPANKNEDIIPGVKGWDMGAAGLAAIWAKENTRASLFEALQRKEVYASTGPRIRLRVFGGWEFAAADSDSKTLADVGYKKGVPMGGQLTAAQEGKAPSFLIRAVKDPKGANLDRIQVIKGWLNDKGMPEEKVYNVSLSGDRKLNRDGSAPAVGNTVDVKTGKYSNTIGDAELAVVWRDPDFDAKKPAFYYVRVLEIPTPRTSTYDIIALNEDPKDVHQPKVIQERVYSSPIWYQPASE
jgi:Protein of unknown function (DUF3604)